MGGGWRGGHDQTKTIDEGAESRNFFVYDGGTRCRGARISKLFAWPPPPTLVCFAAQARKGRRENFFRPVNRERTIATRTECGDETPARKKEAISQMHADGPDHDGASAPINLNELLTRTNRAALIYPRVSASSACIRIFACFLCRQDRPRRSRQRRLTKMRPAAWRVASLHAEPARAAATRPRSGLSWGTDRRPRGPGRKDPLRDNSYRCLAAGWILAHDIVSVWLRWTEPARTAMYGSERIGSTRCQRS